MKLPLELLELHDGRFQWGVSDCVQWAAASVKFFSGRDPLAHYRYSSEAGARAMIAGAGSLEKLVTIELGEPRSRIADTEVGDVVLATFADSGEILGVAEPPVFWLRAARGYVPIELSLALRVWPCRML